MTLTAEAQARLRERIRDVPDWPTPGVLFKDINPLLADHECLSTVVHEIANGHQPGSVDLVAGIEARGFVLGSPVAYVYGAGFVPIRKAGKLPGDVVASSYSLEYGTATVEVQADAFAAGQRVLIVDDVLATGGTAAATVDLVRRAGAEVVGVTVLLELTFLHGRERLNDLSVQSLLTV